MRINRVIIKGPAVTIVFIRIGSELVVAGVFAHCISGQTQGISKTENSGTCSSIKSHLTTAKQIEQAGNALQARKTSPSDVTLRETVDWLSYKSNPSPVFQRHGNHVNNEPRPVKSTSTDLTTATTEPAGSKDDYSKIQDIPNSTACARALGASCTRKPCGYDTKSPHDS